MTDDHPLLITDGKEHPAPKKFEAPIHMPGAPAIPRKPPLSEVFVGPKTPPAEATPKPPADGLPRIRTYAADLSEEIRERGTTLSSIVAAEQSRKPADEPSRKPRDYRTLIIAGGALILIIIGIGSVTAAILLTKKSQAPVVTSSLIFPNQTTSVDVAKAPLADALSSLRQNENLSLGEVEKVNILSGGVPLSPRDLAVALGAPEPLAREVTDAMVGIHAFDRNQPFIILRIAAYDRAFSAALAWEPGMGRALGTFFAPLAAQSGPPTLVFKDAVLQNIDARQSQDQWPVLYAFPTQGILVITTNEYTLHEVLTRLGTTH